MMLQTTTAVALAMLLSGLTTANAAQVALTHATIINPASSAVIHDGTLVIEDDHIAAVGLPNDTKIPQGARTVECTGKFILPGYIDTHVHFFQSADIFTRPDVVDLTNVRPYKDEVAWVKSHLSDVFARYLRSGITSVIDVGGPMWNFEVRKVATSTAKAPRVAVAGPLISSVARPQLDLGDPPIVKIETPEQGREFVRRLAAHNPDYIKIWYIVPPPAASPSPGASPAPGQSDVERAALFRPVVHTVIAESHARKLRVAVHATELEAARAAVEEGADLLVHSVTDKLVDDAFVRLVKERGTTLTPTLVVFERYGRVFAHQLNLTAEEKAWGNPEVIATLDVTRLPADKVPDRIKTALENPDAVLDRIKQTYDVALRNLKTLEDAAIPIAAGTDAGNIGTIHGPALFREFKLMKEAGLTPMQILKSATATAAKTFGGDSGTRIGAIAPGNLADLVILNSNPIEDIAHASDIQTVIKNGVFYPADSLLPR
jgi:imidazolonepropionase-like amidohydrolase